MKQDPPQIDTLYQSYSKGLQKITGSEMIDSIMPMINADPGANNSTMVNVAAGDIGSGPASGMMSFTSGGIESGKEAFADQTPGFFFGIDTDGIAKLNLGNSIAYIRWDGTNLSIVGGLSVSNLDIPDVTTANSFHTDANGNSWWGTNVATGYATAPAKILNTGAATFTNMTITGGSVAASTLAGIVALANTNVAAQNWTQTSVFSASSATVVAWGAGTFTTAGGTAYSIGAGNTGTMSARTYIYLDIAVSITAYQVTTTAATAVGTGKVLVAVAQNAATTATYLVESDQPAIVGNNIAANTITSGKISVSQLSAISADLGAITAGSITINAGVAAIDSSGNSTFKSIQVGGSTRQYTPTDSGIFSYGDGSDGAAAFNGGAVTGASLAGSTYSLTRDVYYSTMVVSDTYDVITAGWRIFCQTSCTIGGGASGKIHWDGNAGGVGASNTTQTNGTMGGGAGGGGFATGYLSGTVLSGTGGQDNATGGTPAPPTVGGDGTATTNSIGSNGVGAAGSGGTGRDSIGGSHGGAGRGAGGKATASNVKLIANWHLATLLDISSSGSTVKFTDSAGAAGGGAGGNGQPGNGSANSSGGGSGGGGGMGGIIAIYAKAITINAGGQITSKGGIGGNGGSGAQNSDNLGGGSGGGGGGTGGNGGIIILVYNTQTGFNAGTNILVTAGGAGTGGAGGTDGHGSGRPGTAGGNGSVGSAGTIYQFNIAL